MVYVRTSKCCFYILGIFPKNVMADLNHKTEKYMTKNGSKIYRKRLPMGWGVFRSRATTSVYSHRHFFLLNYFFLLIKKNTKIFVFLRFCCCCKNPFRRARIKNSPLIGNKNSLFVKGIEQLFRRLEKTLKVFFEVLKSIYRMLKKPL